MFKQRLTRIFAPLLAVMLSACLGIADSAPKVDPHLTALENQVASQDQRIAELGTLIDAISEDRQRLRADLRTAVERFDQFSATEEVQSDKPVAASPEVEVAVETEAEVAVETEAEAEAEVAVGAEAEAEPVRVADASSGLPASVAEADASGLPGEPKFAVHIASYKSVKAAADAWIHFQTRYGDLLGGLSARISILDVPSLGGTFMRLKAGPLVDQAQATALCEQLIVRGEYCVMSTFDGTPLDE